MEWSDSHVLVVAAAEAAAVMVVEDMFGENF
jgi:hypothetical protein